MGLLLRDTIGFRRLVMRVDDDFLWRLNAESTFGQSFAWFLSTFSCFRFWEEISNLPSQDMSSQAQAPT